MTKRRDFIKKSVIGTTGIAIGSMGFSCKSHTSTTTPTVTANLQKDWHTDPEWSNIKYGDWGGPGVSAGPGPMDTILVKDYAPRSSVVNKETFVPKAKYPAIDCHIHVLGKTPEEVAVWVKTMDEVGMETSIVLTGVTGAAFDALVELLSKAYPGRFLLCCGIDSTDIDKPDYSDRAVAELVRCYNNGAHGVGELSDKGSGLTQGLHPDDPRLDAFWVKCAELKMPVTLHVADPYEECIRLGKLISKHPVDVAFVGIGENSHLAFNDPPADFKTEDAYLVVTLNEACRRQQMGEGWFPTINDVPEKAISMSINQIMKSKAIICAVPDLRKADTVKKTVEGQISPLIPASIMRKHKAAWLFLDKDSSSMLS